MKIVVALIAALMLPAVAWADTWGPGCEIIKNNQSDDLSLPCRPSLDEAMAVCERHWKFWCTGSECSRLNPGVDVQFDNLCLEVQRRFSVAQTARDLEIIKKALGQ